MITRLLRLIALVVIATKLIETAADSSRTSGLRLRGINSGRNLNTAYPPSGYCGSQTSAGTCNIYSGCIWTNRCVLNLTGHPTNTPSSSPTRLPSKTPTNAPSKLPTRQPTIKPTVRTRSPTIRPGTKKTKVPTALKTASPVVTRQPSLPTVQVTKAPVFKPVPPTIARCVYPVNNCEKVRVKRTCRKFNGCFWKKRKCLRKPACPPYPVTSKPTATPTELRIPDCVIPSGGCFTVRNGNECRVFSGCNWSKSGSCVWAGCNPPPDTDQPTNQPTSTAPSISPTTSPSIFYQAPTSPTIAPSRAPTFAPTTATPSSSPTLFPRTRNPTPARSPPTAFPTSSLVPRICDSPISGCNVLLDEASCSTYNGCSMINGMCKQKPQCVNQVFNCAYSGSTFHASASLLPACLRADSVECDAQRLDVYNALGLGQRCGDPGMVPCAEGGCTLRRDILQQEVFEELTTFYEFEVFVHPSRGIDTDSQRGDRARPLQSIQFALNRSRLWAPARRRIVLMGPAVHRPNATILLGPLDSNLTFYGEPGSVVSGAIPLSVSWRQASFDPRVMVADIPAAIAGRLEKLAPMFVNNQPAIRARFPNLASFYDRQYVSATKLNTWRRRASTPPLTNRVKVRMDQGNFGFYTQATGGSCDGVFQPPTGYYCDPAHDADGGCPFTLPVGVDMDGKLATQLNYNRWKYPDVHLHTFHPLRWGLWTFQLANLPTPAPTSQRPSNAPTTERPSLAPTVRPSRTPTVSKPTLSPTPPTSRPTAAPTNATNSPTSTNRPTPPTTRSPTVTLRPTTLQPTQKPTTREPTQSPTNARPSSAPTTSPSRRPSTVPSGRPSANPTFQPSRTPSAGPTANPTIIIPSSSPTISPTQLPTLAPTSETMSPTILEPVITEAPFGLQEEEESDEDRKKKKAVSIAGSGDSTLYFDKGGWQEARGDCGNGGGDWFVENDLTLLDFNNEYYIDLTDPSGAKIYYFPNGTTMNAPSTNVELGVLRDVFRTMGTASQPVRSVHFRHLRIEKTYPTHMDDHEVPSGGDWTVHRGGAIVLEGVMDSSVYDCHFFALGGNGVFVSRFGRDLELRRNEFHTLGSSAMLLVGDPTWDALQPWNRSGNPNHIERVLIEENVATEMGIVVKQSSGVMLALAKSIMIRRNVIYNAARAGVVFNDGFGGNNTVDANIVFNTVMETLDHGPFNVWDRQQWLRDPVVNTKTLPFRVVNNVMIGNNNGAKGIDLDDGARDYEVQNNIVLAGLQKFKGNAISVRDNLIFPDIYACVWMTPMNSDPSGMTYINNTCVAATAQPYYANLPSAVALSLCRLRNFVARSNTFIGANIRKSWGMCGNSKLTWSVWQRTYKQDSGTVISIAMPSALEQANMVQDKLKSLFPVGNWALPGRFGQ